MNRRRKFLALRIAATASAFVFGVFVHAVVSYDGDVQAAVAVSEPSEPAAAEDVAGVVDADESSTALNTALALATAPQTWLYLDNTELERQVRAVAADSPVSVRHRDRTPHLKPGRSGHHSIGDTHGLARCVATAARTGYAACDRARGGDARARDRSCPAGRRSAEQSGPFVPATLARR